MPRTLRLVASVVSAAAVLSGCSEEPKVIDVGTRITSAADALECADGDKVETGSVPKGSGAGSEDASSALQAWAEKQGRSSDVPPDGYRVAVEEVGTVLFTHDVDGRALIAVITARTKDADGGLGWTATSWARCRG